MNTLTSFILGNAPIIFPIVAGIVFVVRELRKRAMVSNPVLRNTAKKSRVDDDSDPICVNGALRTGVIDESLMWHD